MSLTQWAEDRPAADKKAVAKAVVAHLLVVAACISPATVQSWAATRWASVNTLFNYCLVRAGPEPFRAPLCAARTLLKRRRSIPGHAIAAGKKSSRAAVGRRREGIKGGPETRRPKHDSAQDILLPAFGHDADVVPRGLANTTATLLDGAHRMGRVGFDYGAYYGGRPAPAAATYQDYHMSDRVAIGPDSVPGLPHMWPS